MSIKEKTLQKVESKIEEVESFIEENGVGSKYLSKASKVQKNVNLGLAIFGIIGIASISTWLLSRD